MLQVRTMHLHWVLSVHWPCRAATLLKSLIFFIKLNQNCALPIFQSAFWSSSFPDNVAALQETSTVWSPDVHSPKLQCYQHLFFFIALPQTGFENSSDTTGPTSGQPLTHTRLRSLLLPITGAQTWLVGSPTFVSRTSLPVGSFVKRTVTPYSMDIFTELDIRAQIRGFTSGHSKYYSQTLKSSAQKAFFPINCNAKIKGCKMVLKKTFYFVILSYRLLIFTFLFN